MSRPSDCAAPPDARLLALVADRTHNAVIIADAAGHVQWVNAGFTRVTGYAPAEVVGRRPGDVLQGPDTDPATVAFMRARIRAGEGFRTEGVNYHKCGAPYWLDIEVQPVTDGAGTVTHFIAIEQDVTERKRGELALRASEERLAEAQRIAHLGSWTWDPAGDRMWWSEERYRLFGVDPAHFRPTFEAFLELVHPADRDRVRWEQQHVSSGADTLDHDYRVIRPDGRTIWVHSRVRATRGANGRLALLEGTAQDITERKLAEAALAEALALQTAILDYAPSCVISLGPDGTVVTFNRTAERELGYTAAELIGRRTPVLWHDPAELEARATEMTARLGRPAAFEELFLTDDQSGPTARVWTFVRKDGTRFPAELTVTTLRGPAGRAIGHLGLATNITHRYEAERTQRMLSSRLAEQNAALEEQSRLTALQAGVGLALNRDVPIAEVLRGCCDTILRNTGAAFVRAWTLNDAADVLELQASVGLYTHTNGPHARVPVGQFKIGRIAASRTPHLTNDVRNDPNVRDPAWAAREGMVAFAGHPLVCGGQLVGVLALFARAALSEGTLVTLRAAADALAMGIARKRAETHVREQERRHRAIVESAIDCIVTVDQRGRITEFNPAAERAFGYSRADVLGRELAGLLVPAEYRDRHMGGIERYLRTRESKILGTRLVGLPALRKDGTRFPVELSIVPTRVGGETAFTAFFRDITFEQAAEAKRREAEQQLQKAKEAAEAAAQTQSQFLANVSHELRTPIAAIVGYAEMLLDPRLGVNERVRAVKTIMRSGRHLTTLVNDVLDLGRIDAGRMELERTSCRLRRLVLEAVAQADVAAREKQLDLRVTPLGRLPAGLTTDPTRLRQIVDNLLSNAVKFTEPGKRVEVRLRLDAGRAAGPHLLIEVEDEGIGIAPEALARLFQPFTQADASTTRRFGGSGLGLSICKRLAHLMGGEITVRSAPGAGSCFALALPVSADDMADLVDEREFSEASQSVLAADPAAPKLAGRVLLAEDTPTIQTVLRYFLERAGLTVEVVGNGRAAVERALAAEFDVILMDMQMPEMDGYAATSALRQSGYERAIVALTAHAMTGDEEKCLQAGCNAYLSKPVDAVRLIRVVARQIPSQSWAVKYDALLRKAPAPQLPPVEPVRPSVPSPMDKLTADYRRALPDKIRALGEALRERNITHLSELAHRLRGSAGMYGLPAVSEAAGRVEDGCRAGQAVPQLEGLVATLENVCAKAGGGAGS
ncbi:PAS domain S-box protein [Frigoriglobus tundricola]|uniref:histidine kinase n=1 Tax=Frigoriglobus tundricola TaxID=2774151 RepID=A0A6M5YVP6_9BACT|nr:PAS domain S-box protein [Frigoriglobus tundricola]QJW98019.1 hypothetical protein FTUN_5599 [Frigoriglobus tundricola]